MRKSNKYSRSSGEYPSAKAPGDLKIRVMRVWALGMLQSARWAKHRHNMLCCTCSWRCNAQADYELQLLQVHKHTKPRPTSQRGDRNRCARMPTAARPDDRSTLTPYCTKESALTYCKTTHAHIHLSRAELSGACE